jgi:hypothetical protein
MLLQTGQCFDASGRYARTLRDEIRTAGGLDRVSLVRRRLLGNCGAKEKDQRLQGNG